jgi:transcriptional regulator with XRE-family HTH domain
MPGENYRMQGFGDRLRARAKELGLSDSEVARRLGLSQNRYSHYVNDKREPDLATLAKICRALATTPDAVLGFTETQLVSSEADVLNQRIMAAAQAMELPTLKVAGAVMDALVANQHHGDGENITEERQ